MMENEEKNICNNINLIIPENSDYIILRVNNATDKFADNVKKLLTDYFKEYNCLHLPKWFLDIVKKYTDDDLWNDEFLLNIDNWHKKMKNRSWRWYSSEKADKEFKIVVTQSGMTNLSELIFLFYCQGIKLKDIVIEDKKYGTYFLKENY